MIILTILPNADPILAIHALADPPPGVDVRAPIDSIKFLTLLLNRGPSVFNVYRLGYSDHSILYEV